MKFILAEKNMPLTQIWVDDKALGCDAGYGPVLHGHSGQDQSQGRLRALQLAYGEKKAKNINKPQLKQFEKLNLKPAACARVRFEENAADFKVGDVVTWTRFNAGDKARGAARYKGKGFQGVGQAPSFRRRPQDARQQGSGKDARFHRPERPGTSSRGRAWAAEWAASASP